MARKRMFDKNLLCDPRFNSLSNSAKYLFFMLCLYADDEGVVADPIGVTKSHRCTKKDLSSLYVTRYLIQCSSGVAIIKHWFAHNYKQESHITKSTYREELSQFIIDERGFYTSKNKDFCGKNAVEGCRKTAEQGRQKMPSSIDKSRLDKNRIDKNNITTTTTTTTTIAKIPTQEEIQTYCTEKGYNFDIDYFIHYWTERDWKRYDKNLKKYVPIKDIKGTIRTWAKNEAKYKKEEEYKAIQNESRKTYIQTNRPKSEIVKESFDKVDEWIDKFDVKKEQAIDANN